jgi:hypothetical protein
LTAVALVSAAAAHALDEDLPPLRAAFAAAGVQAEIADWDDHAVEWERFDAALLRSAWDYTERLSEFLAWVERTATLTTLLNPPSVVRWNSDKHYLAELARQDLPVVASTFCEPGEDAAHSLERFLREQRAAELVVKPAVGAGAEILAHLRALLTVRRAVLLQPYLPSVDRDGETALIYLDGRFSHAIRKGPLLPPGAGATAALFAAEEITPRTAAADEREVAERVLAALPFATLLYARVDLIRGAAGEPRLLELELTEPSLYFAHGAGSAARLVRSTLSRLPAR